MDEKIVVKKKFNTSNFVLGAVLSLISLAYIYPIFMVLINALKKSNKITTDAMFKLPTSETFTGWTNFKTAIETNKFFQSFGVSLLITVTSVAAIIIFCSMCAWFITRVKGFISSFIYYMFVFSMVVPFQMVMLTLSYTATKMHLNSPWTIWIIYLGFGAGLAVFMFAGFMKTIPMEIEEAAMIDGCNPLQTYFKVVLPILKPTLISVLILEAMWVWNDYLLPYLVLDRTKGYQTLPILIRHSQAHMDMLIMVLCLPVCCLLLYLSLLYICLDRNILLKVLQPEPLKDKFFSRRRNDLDDNKRYCQRIRLFHRDSFESTEQCVGCFRTRKKFRYAGC